MSIKTNLAEVNRVKDEAAKRAGRKPEDVLLVAVTKLHSPQEINEAISCGVTDIGENKVQEIVDKYDKVDPVRWHLIGHLQTNKVKYIIDKVCMIHSVDSLKLAREIDKRAAQHNITMDILIQVNTAMDENKFGITNDETGELIEQIAGQCPNVRIRGIMCIAPFAEDPKEIAPFFADARRLFESYKDKNYDRVDFKYLSMGMTHDFEVAIEEGSNVIRVGTAIFGDRDYRKEEK